MRNQAIALAGAGKYPCDAWEKSAAGIDQCDEWQPDHAKWQGFGWSMVLGAIAYGLFIMWWIA